MSSDKYKWTYWLGFGFKMCLTDKAKFCSKGVFVLRSKYILPKVYYFPFLKNNEFKHFGACQMTVITDVLIDR